MPWPIDIHIQSDQDVVSIDRDELKEAQLTDMLDLLRDSQATAYQWTQFAAEYWRLGRLDDAEQLAVSGIEVLTAKGMSHGLSALHALLSNIQLARVRSAPKVILPDAKMDILHEKTKEDYHGSATQHLNHCAEDSEYLSGQTCMLTRAIMQLSTRAIDDALKSFDFVLTKWPTNLVALMGKARILLLHRKHREALRLFQHVLQLNPNCKPDPRIGIGMCLWSLGYKDKARLAWQRSHELDPTDWSVNLLLGLYEYNAAMSDEETDEYATLLVESSLARITSAFKKNNKSAAASNILAEILLLKKEKGKAMKLAERTIQFADTLSMLHEGHLRLARVAHRNGDNAVAMKNYEVAVKSKNVLASIGLAQMQMLNDEIPAAIHTLDTLVKLPEAKDVPEALVMLASLRAYHRPGISSSDLAKERARARELYTRISSLIADGARRVPAVVASDPDMYIEIAQLWQTDNRPRTLEALEQAARVCTAPAPGVEERPVDPRLMNNQGVLHHMQGRHEPAVVLYRQAITKTLQLGSEGEMMGATMLYNLGRVYEDSRDDSAAKEAYDKLLELHPEYVDAKIRQAHMLIGINKHNEAHDLLKQALQSQPSHGNLRAYYTYFLSTTHPPRITKEFVFATLKDHDKNDVYALCAAGAAHYAQARESRDNTSKGLEDRKRNFQRAVECYDRALYIDSRCAVAAMGLAIATAEDALDTLSRGKTEMNPAARQREELARRKQHGEALDLFGKIRESLDSGDVYINIGHSHFFREEFDKAIAQYESALKHLGHRHVPLLLYLARAWYTRGTRMKRGMEPRNLMKKEWAERISHIKKALAYAEKALHVSPGDKAIQYNIAMITQKPAELLLNAQIQPHQRELDTLQWAIDCAHTAQKLYAALSADESPVLPYSRDIADQRHTYGNNLLRRADEALQKQREYENTINAEHESTRRMLQEKRERKEAEMREAEERRQREMEELAKARQVAQAEAYAWSRDIQAASDEEREQKAAKKTRRATKRAESPAAGEEGAEPKKRKRQSRLKKGGRDAAPDSDGDVPMKEEDDAAEDEALFSDGEGEEPAKKRTRKQRVVDDDDEEAPPASAPPPSSKGHSRKQFKSKEVLSDTDDEDMVA
ncbi:hypothetical protein K523DRAFT_412179 [Schizophyllum commune Tattone D]|nr:hypothetical protein K523DRAFT_412179 [Schizophyllum commune Tattone D]